MPTHGRYLFGRPALSWLSRFMPSFMPGYAPDRRRAWTRHGASMLAKLMKRAAKAAGLGPECVPHGLRKAMLRRLAERGGVGHGRSRHKPPRVRRRVAVLAQRAPAKCFRRTEAQATISSHSAPATSPPSQQRPEFLVIQRIAITAHDG